MDSHASLALAPEAKARGFKIGRVRGLPPDLAKRKPHWRLRYTDPDTGEHTESTGSASEAKARKDAAALNARIQKTLAKRREAELIGVPYIPETAQARYEVRAISRLYYEHIQQRRREENEELSSHTLRNVENGLNEFCDWCEKKFAVYFDQLTEAVLKEWRGSPAVLMCEDGRTRRGVGTIELRTKVVLAMLRWANETKYAPHLPYGISKRAINVPKVKGRKARSKFLSRAQDEGRVLGVLDLRATLRAAIRFDRGDRAPHRTTNRSPKARRKGGRLAGPDIALLLLAGLRRGEYVQLDVSEVHVDRPAKYNPDEQRSTDIELPGSKAKGGIARTIEMTRYSPLGEAILKEAVAGRNRKEWLSEAAYVALAEVVAELKYLGAPGDLHSHDLRATCATYSLKISGITPQEVLKRQGDTEQTAAEHYFRIPTGVREGPSLEVIMGIETELTEILDMLRERNTHNKLPRNEYRKSLAVKVYGIAGSAAEHRARKVVRQQHATGKGLTGSRRHPANQL